MQNAFLNKVQKSMDSTLQLAQTSSPVGDVLESGLEGTGLKNIYETKFVVWNTEWSVIDWTIFCIILAIIIVAIAIGLCFCCCIGSTEADELREAMEKAKKEAEDKDFMEYKAGEESLVAGLGAAGAEAPMEAPMEEAM